MSRESVIRNFEEYLTVSGAAEFLGVSRATLRNWDRNGKLKPRRHPQNGYRIYLHEDLEAVLRSADLSTLTDASFAPGIDFNQIGDREHFVQFYDDDAFLVESVSAFVGAALTEGNSSVVIATPEHRSAMQRKLGACGIDMAQATALGRYVVLDASETLSKFMVAGSPDRERFMNTVGKVIARQAESGVGIHAFGEMVALLWADGKREAAIKLEELWNELGTRYRFALFCAYPMNGFGKESDAMGLNGVCSCHTRVIPAESYAALASSEERRRAITLLQQKAQSLQAEIAHRHEVERALTSRELELSDFFENATEGLHKVGPDSTILWANRADYELLGYAADEYVGRSITEFHSDAQVITLILEKLALGETLKNFPARLRCKDGSIKHVLISSNACFEDGQFAYTRCFTRDVTREWQAENSLRESDRRKDEFLATLAHELRNPLAPIRNALELLEVENVDMELLRAARSVMKRQIGQLARLVDDLMDVSRITRDKLELRTEPIELAAVIKEAIETSRPLIDVSGHELTINLPTEEIFINADLTRMSQVFSNLLNNSAKYTERGGKIVIEAKQCGTDVTVAVRDNGIGIACEELANVFDMFRQVDRSLERSQGGLGIGLTLVRRLVELHGGTVNAQSEGLGKGSEFVVRLPIATEGVVVSKAANRENGGKTKRLRILVADDNKDAGETLSLYLRIKGHQVRTVRDGAEAVELVPNFRPQVVLMDIGMPNLNGYDATRAIRKLACGKDSFIVALTGWGQDSDIERSFESGCSAHLVKPVDLAALEQMIATAFASTDSAA
jgi:PAS domain S-box-containing protein